MSEPLLAEDHESIGRIFRELHSSLEEGEVEESFKRLDLLWARLAVHIRAEHLCLFPAILDACARSRGMPTLSEAHDAIDRLREDHNFFMRELAALVEIMGHARRSDDTGTQAELAGVRHRLAAIESRLAAHNELEEEKVYGWTSLLLGGEELERLRTGVRSQLENLPPRLEAES